MLINIGAERNSSREFARKSYTLKHKRSTVRAVETFLSSGVSIDEACALGCVERRVFYRWKKTLSHLKDGTDNVTVEVTTEMPVENEATFEIAVVPTPVLVPMVVAKTISGQVRSLHPGRVSILAPKKIQLLHWIFEQCKQGLKETTRLVKKWQRNSSPSFVRKPSMHKIKF